MANTRISGRASLALSSALMQWDFLKTTEIISATETGYGHSGDLGDIIYSLPAIRAKGRGVLNLFPSSGCTELMTRQRAEAIIPLLRAQSYLEEVNFTLASGPSALNRFRGYLAAYGGAAATLIEAHQLALGVPPNPQQSQWIFVDNPICEAQVIFSRSERYSSQRFDWKRVYEAYSAHAAFIGLPHEHESFCNEIGPIPHIKTFDLHEVARVIAGCQLFVGNQSSPMAIAHGLKIRSIMEVAPHPWNNCCLDPSHVLYANDNDFELPKI